MARSLERLWPHIVTIDRRFGRPQHVVDWKRLKARLTKKKTAKKVKRRVFTVKQQREIKSSKLKRMVGKKL